ncbi:MAG: hypothetical protein P8Q36_20175 [Alphaproteobacteria bacterium]|nr:hypothetical protein [Rhodospirillaceae bacterium]MBT6509840.1 hypothetical protein [Rhodospirillaceae bacterium]MBT7613556.1 hypothetical protein [Rhodospirillaceae bacterium]MBT7649068.1 hypothetical protein [Rhodospirillaceae bacterium]MDG2483161.1 hypothetical protein [Alphaproteobacteria bacterium]
MPAASHSRNETTLPEGIDPASLVDLERYPLLERESPAYQALVDDLHDRLLAEKILPMEDFLTPEGIRLLLADAETMEPSAYHCAKTGNPYGIDPAKIDALPNGHPGKIMSPTVRDGVAYHDMQGSLCAALYAWPPLRRFVADVLKVPELYLQDDPSNALVLQFYKPGGKLAWHFDRSKYSTILQLQAADEGGYFEAAPGIRDAENENYDAVRALVLGETEPPLRRKSKPGTFVIINGNHTLHRVTDIGGDRARMSLILAYEEEPGVLLPVYLRRIFFGPDCPGD